MKIHNLSRTPCSFQYELSGHPELGFPSFPVPIRSQIPAPSCPVLVLFPNTCLSVGSAGSSPDVRRISAGCPMNVLRIRRIELMSSKCPPDILPYVHQVSAGCSPDCPPDVRRFFRRMTAGFSARCQANAEYHCQNMGQCVFWMCYS